SGVASLFSTVYCMINLQDTIVFSTRSKCYVPSCINATWIALIMLALAAVLIKLPSEGQAGTESSRATRVRFAVARDLPSLGSSREMIETGWGAPTLAKSQELRYQMKDGAIVFCLDPKGV